MLKTTHSTSSSVSRKSALCRGDRLPNGIRLKPGKNYSSYAAQAKGSSNPSSETSILPESNACHAGMPGKPLSTDDTEHSTDEPQETRDQKVPDSLLSELTTLSQSFPVQTPPTISSVIDEMSPSVADNISVTGAPQAAGEAVKPLASNSSTDLASASSTMTVMASAVDALEKPVPTLNSLHMAEASNAKPKEPNQSDNVTEVEISKPGIDGIDLANAISLTPAQDSHEPQLPAKSEPPVTIPNTVNINFRPNEINSDRLRIDDHAPLHVSGNSLDPNGSSLSNGTAQFRNTLTITAALADSIKSERISTRHVSFKSLSSSLTAQSGEPETEGEPADPLVPQIALEFNASAPPGTQTKTGDLKQTVAQQILEQTIEPAVSAARQIATLETRKLNLRLQPAEYGRINVTLSRNAAGQLNAHLSADNETARQALSKGIGQLRQALEGAGVSVASLDVNTSQTFQADTGGQSRQEQSGTFQHATQPSIDLQPEPAGMNAGANNRLLSVRA